MHLLAQATLSDDLHTLTGTVSDAKASSDATINFSQLVAHELRNAIGPIRSAVTRLFGNAPHEKQQTARLQNRVVQGLERLEGFADDVTRLGRHGKQQGPIAIPEAVEQALAATATERNGHLQIERHLVDATVWGARDRFVLALANLIRNAAQVATDTQLLLHISMSIHDTYVELRFEDNGPGIAAENATQIFESGFSVPSAKQSPGTGLGLAFVREVIEEEMRGSVVYTPAEKGGSVFLLQLALTGGENP